MAVDTPHLGAAVDLADHDAAPGTGLGVVQEQLGGLHILVLTHVVCIMDELDHALLANLLVTETTVPCIIEDEAATVIIDTTAHGPRGLRGLVRTRALAVRGTRGYRHTKSLAYGDHLVIVEVCLHQISLSVVELQ